MSLSELVIEWIVISLSPNNCAETPLGSPVIAECFCLPIGHLCLLQCRCWQRGHQVVCTNWDKLATYNYVGSLRTRLAVSIAGTRGMTVKGEFANKLH